MQHDIRVSYQRIHFCSLCYRETLGVNYDFRKPRSPVLYCAVNRWLDRPWNPCASKLVKDSDRILGLLRVPFESKESHTQCNYVRSHSGRPSQGLLPFNFWRDPTMGVPLATKIATDSWHWHLTCISCCWVCSVKIQVETNCGLWYFTIYSVCWRLWYLIHTCRGLHTGLNWSTCTCRFGYLHCLNRKFQVNQLQFKFNFWINQLLDDLFPVKRFIRSSRTQKLKCRAFQELSICKFT